MGDRSRHPIQGVANLEDIRRRARRRLPRIVFDYVDGAAADEWTARANRRAFEEVCFLPQPLVDVSCVDQRTSILGREVSTPVLLGPAGGTALVRHDGELAVARAAARVGTIYVLASAACHTIEEVADAGAGATLWLQLYLWRERKSVQGQVERAERSGYHALCLTVDSAVHAHRDRNIRNGMTMPPKLTGKNAANVLRHPRWLAQYLADRPVVLKNLEESARSKDPFAAPAALQNLKNTAATWEELRWLRRLWNGPLVVKGVLTAEAASTAFDLGSDGVICSNHGGRELDGTPPSFSVLPRLLDVAESYGKDVFLDGGVRRGSDVVKALALGARACLITRPYHWGLAVAGEQGVVQVCEMLQDEIESVMGMLGRPQIADLDRSALERFSFTRDADGFDPAKRDEAGYELRQ